MNDSRLVKMICILVLLSLDKSTTVDLKMTLERTIALAVGTIGSVEHVRHPLDPRRRDPLSRRRLLTRLAALCLALPSPAGDQTVLQAGRARKGQRHNVQARRSQRAAADRPRRGPARSGAWRHLSRRLGRRGALGPVALLSNLPGHLADVHSVSARIPQESFEKPPDVGAVAALVSLEDRQSKFVIATETDYAQMIASIRLLALVVGDTESLFKRAFAVVYPPLERGVPETNASLLSARSRRRDRRGQQGQQGEGRRRHQDARGQPGQVRASHQCVVPLPRSRARSPTERLTPLCPLRILPVDARASNLDRSAAKAFLLNLHVSVGYKATMFERMHQPKRAKGELGRQGQTTLAFRPVPK